MKKFTLLLLMAITIQIAPAQVPSYVPTNGLVGYWPFNGNANDESGNGNNGTVNGATLATDKNGNLNSAYSFDGTSNNVGLSQPFFGGVQVNSFTFYTRFKSIGSPVSGSAYNIWGKTFFWGEVNFGVAPDNTIYIVWANSNVGNTYTHVQTNTGITPNSWIDAVITFENSHISIYINGVLQSSSDYYGTNSLANFAQDANSSKIGSKISSGQTGGFFNGTIDDFGIWNRALTPQEITNLYNSTSSNECLTMTINTGVLSINPETYTSTVTIYPNPANDQITIDCGTIANVSGWSIKITNALGQEVFSQPMNTQQYVVPLNTWSGQGMYFVKISNAQNEVVNIKKIILK
jgi:hypothetical protein